MEYDGITSLYIEHTRQIACTLSVHLSTPHVLNQGEVLLIGLRCGPSVGFICLGPCLAIRFWYDCEFDKAHGDLWDQFGKLGHGLGLK